jgi:hypothetical protein
MVYINDPSGLFTADELARIQDAIDNWDALLAPYNVTITEVSDPTVANLVIDTGTTSVCGGASDGVLGCFNGANSEITLIQGWNWYAGGDPTQVGADQYDFETTVTHELGHALGLGHSADPGSPMYATLATGVADRTVAVADLNIPDPPDGADPQRAAPGRNANPPASARAASSSSSGVTALDFVLTEERSILHGVGQATGPAKNTYRVAHVIANSKSPRVSLVQRPLPMDPAAVDVLLSADKLARSSWAANQPTPRKPFLL